MTTPAEYHGQLPQALRDKLATAPRGDDRPPLPVELRYAIAREAFTIGIRPRGAVLAYVVLRLRHGLGIGDYPTPPEMPPGERALVDARIYEAIQRLKEEAHQADPTSKPTPRLENPAGWTDPAKVITHDELEQARQRRRHDPNRVAAEADRILAEARAAGIDTTDLEPPPAA